MATPVADPSDVRARLNLPDKDTTIGDTTGITNAEIQPYLEDAAFDIERASNRPLDADLRMQLEWRLAGIKILSTRKGLRAEQQKSLGSSSRSFEVKSVEELKEWVKRNGPSGLVDDGFWHVTLQE